MCGIIIGWKTTTTMEDDLIFFENEDDLKNKATKKKYDFETFHVVRSNQNNKIWTLKRNTLMVLTLL